MKNANTTPCTTPAAAIAALFEEHPELSLRRFCDVLSVGYQYVLKMSKKPVAGQAYDPDARNYAEIAKILDRKGCRLEDTDWDAVCAETKRYEPLSELDEFQPGIEFRMRATGNHEADDVFEVLLRTETHIVFEQVGDTQPRVMNFDTFLHQSPRVVR